MSTSVLARVGRLVTVVVLSAASCLLAAGTGWAGGPTSALLVSPDLERAAGVYYSDPEYQLLETLLAEPAVSDPSVEVPSGGSGYITVTWLVHDVSIWRIDRILLAKDGNHLIITQLMNGPSNTGDGMYPGQLGDDTAIKHRATDPAALQSLLEKLGLTGVAPGGTTDVAGPADQGAQAQAARNEAVQTGVVETAAGPAGAGAAPWWLLAGVVLGIVVAVTAIRYLPAVRRRILGEPASADDEPVRMTQLPV